MRTLDAPFCALLREARWSRVFSLCFQPPRPGLCAELRALVSEMGSEGETIAHLVSCASLDHDYHYILGSGGVCSPSASAYLGGSLGGKERILADVAGFYTAFGFRPHLEIQETCDHIAVELSFLSFLTVKEGYALYQGLRAQEAVCRLARRRFTSEHLIPWIPRLSDALSEKAPGTFYHEAARKTVEILIPMLT